MVKIADWVDDNWSCLADELPDGVEALDFFHASEHLHAAVAAMRLFTYAQRCECAVDGQRAPMTRAATWMTGRSKP